MLSEDEANELLLLIGEAINEAEHHHVELPAIAMLGRARDIAATAVDDACAELHVVSVGSPFNGGMALIGPFRDGDEALAWADGTRNTSGDEWHVIRLQSEDD